MKRQLRHDNGIKNRSSFVIASIFLWIGATTTTTCSAARFNVIGPQLTLTLKDPDSSSFSSSDSSSKRLSLPEGDAPNNRFLSLSGLSPNLLWKIESQSPPLPKLLSSLKSFAATVGYKYDEIKTRPSVIAADFEFGSDASSSSSSSSSSLTIRPSYEFKRRESVVTVRIGDERSLLLATLSSKAKKMIKNVKGSYKILLPQLHSLSSLTVSPNFDFGTMTPSCVISGETGTRRTTAIVDLNIDNPTLKVIHALDERNTIAPEISLYNANILYDWNVALPSGSLRARVDPTSAIDVTWTDNAEASNGRWVTEFKLPLEGSGGGPLAADIRVRRHFAF